MSDLDKILLGRRLARAVLLFHSGVPWTEEKATEWFKLIGTNEATTKNLCDLAQKVREERRL